MKVTIEIPDAIAEAFRLQGKQIGLDLESYCLTMLLKTFGQTNFRKTRTLAATEHFEKWLIEDKVREHTSRFKAKDIYIYYHRWCQKNGYDALHLNEFGKHLSYTDIPKSRDSLGFNYWVTCDAMWLEELKYKDPAAYKREMDNREFDEALARSEQSSKEYDEECRKRQLNSAASLAASSAPAKATAKHMPKPPRSERSKGKQSTTAPGAKKA